MKLTKSYKHKLICNNTKIKYVEDILYPEWIRVSKILVNLHINHFYKNGVLSKQSILIKNINSFFTQRYLDCIDRQIIGILQSKISNAKNYYKKVIHNSNLDKELKKQYHTINLRNIFFLNQDPKGLISQDILLNARKIFKKFFGKIPDVSNINMVIQEKIAIIEIPKNIKSSDIKYLIKLSSGNKNIRGQFIYLPIKINKYSDQFNGTLCSSSQLNFKNGKLIDISLTKKEIDIEQPKLLNIEISFDIGNNILFALSNGDTYGSWYMKKIKRFDKQLIKIGNNLKLIYGNHVKLTEYKGFTNLVNRIQDFSKNEINRLLNKIFNKYRPYKINLENLDFRKSNIGKLNNRILNRFGLGKIHNKLNQLNQEYNVIINKIDSSYSSQTCNSCKYIDSNNRKQQKIFNCLCCGKKLNADVNAGKIIEYFSKRFTNLTCYNKQQRNNKRTEIINDFINNFGRMDDKRIIQVLLKNPYFKDYHIKLRKLLL